MRYIFSIDDLDGKTHEVKADVTNKKLIKLVSAPEGHDGVLFQWTYDDYDDKPTAAYTVTVSNPSPVPDDWPDSDDEDQTIDMYAWIGLVEAGEHHECTMIEWADGRAEVTMPEHDVPGMACRPE